MRPCPFTSYACSVAQDLPLSCRHARVGTRQVSQPLVSLIAPTRAPEVAITGHPSEPIDTQPWPVLSSQRLLRLFTSIPFAKTVATHVRSPSR